MSDHQPVQTIRFHVEKVTTWGCGCASEDENIEDGVGMPTIMALIRDKLPVARWNGAETHKDIVRTTRSHCPCCPTVVMALVRIWVEGTWDERAKQIIGLYQVTVGGSYEGCLPDSPFKIEKLDGRVIDCGRTRTLARPPKRDEKTEEETEAHAVLSSVQWPIPVRRSYTFDVKEER